MVHGSAVFLCELLVGILILTAVAAVGLKSSCYLYNLVAGAWANSSGPPAATAFRRVPQTGITLEPRSRPVLKADWPQLPSVELPLPVPNPSFEWAMCIIFAAALVSGLAYFILIRVLHLLGMAVELSSFGSLPIQIILLPLTYLIQSGMNAAMLPTSFGKGLLIALIYIFLTLLIAAVLFVVLVLIALVFRLDFHRLGA